MRILKIVMTGAVLAGLLGTLVPQQGLCQMPAVTEQCPCCQPTQDKAPACPMMKAQPPRDLIGTSSICVTPALELIAVLDVAMALVSPQKTAQIDLQPQIPKDFFYRTPQIGPAPPALDVLA